jgi:Ca2+-binding RTX toxin-like protein
LIVAIAVAAGLVPGTATAARPVNDDLAAATSLAARSGAVVGTTKEATKQGGEPSHAGNPGGASVWYAWHADTGGSVSLHIEAGFDTLLAVYTGSGLGALIEVASNDDFEAQQTSRLEFDAVAGTDYRFAVDGYGGAVGVFTLAWSQAPLNDDFDDAETITGEEGTVRRSNEGATTEADEPSHAERDSFNSIWFRWTAPHTGSMRFETAGSTPAAGSDAEALDTVLAVYTGTALADLTPVAGNDDFFSLTSAVSFHATQGTVYTIAVGGYRETAIGEVLLAWFPGAIVFGTTGRDVIAGTPGHDYIDGGPGADSVSGAAGDDVLVGGEQSDVLRGGPGNDTLFGRDGVRGNDTLNGGPGVDLCRADRRDRRVGCP